jgi:hypothetical protein
MRLMEWIDGTGGIGEIGEMGTVAESTAFII